MFATREVSRSETEYLEAVEAKLSTLGQDPAQRARGYAERLLGRDLPVIFDLAHLAYITGVQVNVLASMAKKPEPHYSVFRIPKRSGGSREISAPRPVLKHIQTWIAREILSKLVAHPACHGFAPDRSVITNAEPHVGAPVILKLDLAEFFPSIRRDRVFDLSRTWIPEAGGVFPCFADIIPGSASGGPSQTRGSPTSSRWA